MTQHSVIGKCPNCGRKLSGRTDAELEANAKSHAYFKHPAVYSVFQGYSEIGPNGMLRPVKKRGAE